MDETAKLVLTALGGAGVAFAGGLLGAWLQGRREQRRWLRAERLKAYLAIYETVVRITGVLQTVESSTDAEKLIEAKAEAELANEIMTSAIVQVTILGPEKVLAEMIMVSRALGNRDIGALLDSQDLLVSRMKSALGSWR